MLKIKKSKFCDSLIFQTPHPKANKIWRIGFVVPKNFLLLSSQ
jgi:hypothetical protein